MWFILWLLIIDNLPTQTFNLYSLPPPLIFYPLFHPKIIFLLIYFFFFFLSSFMTPLALLIFFLSPDPLFQQETKTYIYIYIYTNSLLREDMTISLTIKENHLKNLKHHWSKTTNHGSQIHGRIQILVH